MTGLRVRCLQVEPGDPERALAEVERASPGDLVVLPELWPAGYFAFDRYRAVATPLDGPLLGADGELARLAGRLGITLHAGSVLEAGAGGVLHNTSAVFGPDGRRLAVYRKVHVFGYRSREQELVTGGTEVATYPLAAPGPRAGAAPFRAGMATCYDLRFPELFRAMADEVACFVVPAAWPAARTEHWSALLRARAIEDQAFVVGCNAAGTDHGVAVAGRSAVVDPWGAVVAEAGEGPGQLEVTIDLEIAAAARSEFPALADRRWPAARGGEAPPPGPPGSEPGVRR